MPRIMLLFTMITMGLVSQPVHAESVISDTERHIYLDLKQANSPTGIDSKAGINVVQGRGLSLQHIPPDVNVNRILRSSHGIVIDSNVGSLAVTSEAGECGPLCLGNKLRVHDASEEETPRGSWNVAPNASNYSVLNGIKNY